MGKCRCCFWHPVAAVAELADNPVIAVKLLGERPYSIALISAATGSCPNGVRTAARCRRALADRSAATSPCASHAWKFDATGQCLETPAEPAGSKLKARIKIAGYPVQEMAGLLWAYLGEAPAPLLPRFEHMVRDYRDWDIGRSGDAVQLAAKPLRTRSTAGAHRVLAHEVHQLRAQALGSEIGERAASRQDRFRIVRIRDYREARVGRR